MLFVIGMEVLTAVVNRTVEEQLLQNLAGITPLQRISVFADDVVIFLKPDVSDLLAVKEILGIFGEASGLKINYRKTTANLIRGQPKDGDRVKELLNCEIARFPIRYLGLQLALRPLTKAEWQPILDKAMNFVPAWQRGLIARPGRLILIKSVIMAKIIHHLLIAEAPVWLLDEIVKWLQAFFWAGKKEVNGGQCLVSWDDICQPNAERGPGRVSQC
jgi:hypothetical protein